MYVCVCVCVYTLTPYYRSLLYIYVCVCVCVYVCIYGSTIVLSLQL
jgi:hypothetical protein